MPWIGFKETFRYTYKKEWSWNDVDFAQLPEVQFRIYI